MRISRMVGRKCMISLAMALIAVVADAPAEELPLAKVPAAVLASADKAVPKATWTEASRDVTDGVTTYEISGTDAKNRPVWVTLTAAGVATEVQTEVDYKDIPGKVREAVASATPKFTPSTAYEVVERGKLVRYDFEGTDANDREVSGSVSPDGKVDEFLTDIPVKDVPPAVEKALRARFPKFATASVHEVRLAGKVIRFDYDGRRVSDKEDITVSVSADGRTIEVHE